MRTSPASQYFLQILLHKHIWYVSESTTSAWSPSREWVCSWVMVPNLGFSCLAGQLLGALSCRSLKLHSALAMVSAQFLERSFLGQSLCTYKKVSSVCKPFDFPWGSSFSLLRSLPKCHHCKKPNPTAWPQTHSAPTNSTEIIISVAHREGKPVQTGAVPVYPQCLAWCLSTE